MMKQVPKQEETTPLDLVDGAFHLIRRAPASVVAAYGIGTLPFQLALLYFWSDMARSAFASERLVGGTLGLAVLFVWMKTWQAVFARQLLARLCGEAAPRLELRWLLRTAVLQSAIQPLGLFLLPISLLLVVPTGWVYAYFNNATLFSTTATDVRSLHRKSWEQAKLWAIQSHIIVFLFKLFALVIFFNVMLTLLGVPWMMKVMLGIETIFSQSQEAMMNTTVLAGAACLTFLSIDPVLKAIYVLRCFHGESLATGQDLKAELRTYAESRKPATVTLFVLLCGLAASSAFAAEEMESSSKASAGSLESLSAPALNRSIDEVIQRREYSWRLPRETKGKKTTVERDNFVVRFIKQIKDMVGELVDWLSQRGNRATPSGGGLNFAGAIRGILYLLLAGIAAWLVWLLFRLWTGRTPANDIIAHPTPALPNLADENVGAEQLPEDGWRNLARDLLERGELRLALRAFYLSTLAHLAGRNLIGLARFKSNRDYERELSRRAHAFASLPELFRQNVTTFERVWYGPHEVTREILAEFAENADRLKAQT